MTYFWKDAAKYGKGEQVGLIAQEVEKVFPQTVVTDSKTGFKSIAYDHLVAPAIEAIKSLAGKLRDQGRDIASLKSENAELKARADKLEKENADIRARLDRLEKSR